MKSSRKSEWPPLLEEGFHEKRLEDLQKLCVDAFPASKSRASLLANLREVIARIEHAKIPMEIWIDGSFLTSKLNPEDIDIVVSVDAKLYNNGTKEQRALLDWIRGHECRYKYNCQARTLMRYPEGHKLYHIYKIELQEWLSWFGYNSRNTPKGIALVRWPQV